MIFSRTEGNSQVVLVVPVWLLKVFLSWGFATEKMVKNGGEARRSILTTLFVPHYIWKNLSQSFAIFFAFNPLIAQRIPNAHLEVLKQFYCRMCIFLLIFQKKRCWLTSNRNWRIEKSGNRRSWSMKLSKSVKISSAKGTNRRGMSKEGQTPHKNQIVARTIQAHRHNWK